MDKVDKIMSVMETNIHTFYCDECGEFLMKSTEYDDGYYERPEEFHCAGIILMGYHCKKCGEEKVQKATEMLKELGFYV